MISGAPAGAHKIQGIGANFIPKNFDRAAADGVIAVADNDAIRASRLLAKHEGLLVGISSGAALHAAIQLARQPENKEKNHRCPTARHRRTLSFNGALRI